MLVNLSGVESVAAVGAIVAPQVTNPSFGPAVLVLQPQSKAMVGMFPCCWKTPFLCWSREGTSTSTASGTSTWCGC